VDQQTLDARIMTAHADDDQGLLATLYGLAADQAEHRGDVDTSCYFLTQAWIFALHAGCAEADEFERRLVCYGRA